MAEQLIRASAQRVPGSAQKARLVADQVRGVSALDALDRLKFMPHKAARQVAKVVRSAVANAEEAYGLDAEELYVHTVAVDEGPTRRWRRFGARGRWKPILRRTSHITVLLASHEELGEEST
ncbi:MAG: 50S ribosomal protein L22 [Anaerolineales bacterium]